jgi:gamma-glutamylcyclotransferase (GGCT)/AIG2-like uncharacterized protein YtfP
MDCDFFFVYGTLRQDNDNEMSRLLASYAELISPATFQGKLYLVDTYPGVVPSANPSDLVHGEVYRLHEPDILLSQLDAYEECGIDFPEPTEFVRKICEIRLADGTRIQAWVYLYNLSTEKLELIRSGNFLVF